MKEKWLKLKTKNEIILINFTIRKINIELVNSYDEILYIVTLGDYWLS